MNTIANAFIQPDDTLRDLAFDAVHAHLNVKIFSGHRADLSQYRGLNSVFDEITTRLPQGRGYEDQCSAQYYFDLFNGVRNAYGEINRIVEVGVYMGGASSILAGCAAKMSLDLDLVDINASFLRFSHERIRRSFPEVAGRVRLFHGDLPTYVRDVLLAETGAQVLLQHDGAHSFNQVVRDLGTLFYVRDRLHSVAIQDTHLRGMPREFNFVDAAVCAIFGFSVNFAPMGTSYSADDTEMTTPNRYQGNYFVPDQREGMFIPMNANQFAYPHPAIGIDEFFAA